MIRSTTRFLLSSSLAAVSLGVAYSSVFAQSPPPSGTVIPQLPVAPSASSPSTVDLSQSERETQAQNLYLQAELVFAEDPYQALALLTEAIRLNSGFSAAYVLRGQAYYALEQPSQAVSDLRAAIQLTPNDYESQVLLALLLSKRGEYAQAAALLDRAIATSPIYGPAREARGVLRIEHLDNQLGAIEDFAIASTWYQQNGEVEKAQQMLAQIEAIEVGSVAAVSSPTATGGGCSASSWPVPFDALKVPWGITQDSFMQLYRSQLPCLQEESPGIVTGIAETPSGPLQMEFYFKAAGHTLSGISFEGEMVAEYEQQLTATLGEAQPVTQTVVDTFYHPVLGTVTQPVEIESDKRRHNSLQDVAIFYQPGPVMGIFLPTYENIR